MLFTIKNIQITAGDPKSLIRASLYEHGFVPSDEDILCNGVPYLSDESEFRASYNGSIEQYKSQIDLIISDYYCQVAGMKLRSAKANGEIHKVRTLKKEMLEANKTLTEAKQAVKKSNYRGKD